jgi:hypothetical protein
LIGVHGLSVSELPVQVVTPAREGTVVEDGARVVHGCNNRHSGPSRAKINQDRRGLIAGHGSIAQPSIIVAAPALQGTVVKDRTGVDMACRNGNRRSARTKVSKDG